MLTAAASLLIFFAAPPATPTPKPSAAAVATATPAPTTAELRVVFDKNWSQGLDPSQNWIGSAEMFRLIPGAESSPVVLPASATGTVVSFATKIGRSRKFRRDIVVLPGVKYVIRGNPCARWELATEPATPFRTPEIRIETARGVSAQRHPVKVLSSYQKDAPGDDVVEHTIAAPGTTKPLVPALSAMCLRSGVDYTIVDANRNVLFENTIVFPEGRISTLSVSTSGSWSVSVGEATPPEKKPK